MLFGQADGLVEHFSCLTPAAKRPVEQHIGQLERQLHGDRGQKLAGGTPGPTTARAARYDEMASSLAHTDTSGFRVPQRPLVVSSDVDAARVRDAKSDKVRLEGSSSETNRFRTASG